MLAPSRLSLFIWPLCRAGCLLNRSATNAKLSLLFPDVTSWGVTNCLQSRRAACLSISSARCSNFGSFTWRESDRDDVWSSGGVMNLHCICNKQTSRSYQTVFQNFHHHVYLLASHPHQFSLWLEIFLKNKQTDSHSGPSCQFGCFWSHDLLGGKSGPAGRNMPGSPTVV